MKITLSSEARLLHILRAVVTMRAGEAGFPEAEAENLALAVDEAASNVIRHTYGGRSEARLALEIRAFHDRVEFLLEDSGPKVSADLIHHRSLDEVRPGGLGTLFINSYFDSVSYDPNFTEGNRLRMLKYLPRKVTT
jgi:serine/threonine-protein kinase RsbW